MRLVTVLTALGLTLTGALAAPAPIALPSPNANAAPNPDSIPDTTVPTIAAPPAAPAPFEVRELPDISWPTPGNVPEYMNKTFIYFPSAGNWWTLGVTNRVEWQWGSSDKASLRIELCNSVLLTEPIVLTDSTPAADFYYETKDKVTRPRAGSGYRLILYMAGTDEILAMSDFFEIKPVGSNTDVVKPYLAAASAHANSGDATRSETVAIAVLVAVFAALMWV